MIGFEVGSAMVTFARVFVARGAVGCAEERGIFVKNIVKTCFQKTQKRYVFDKRIQK